MLKVPEKRIRASVIREYVERANYDGVVCFSCGHASAELKLAGLDVVDVSRTGDLDAMRWWTPEQIRRIWPNRFDATSGHLPVPLMVRIAFQLRLLLIETIDRNTVYIVPTGSGETITCLRWAFPDVKFVHQFGVSPEVVREPGAPLLGVLEEWENNK